MIFRNPHTWTQVFYCVELILLAAAATARRSFVMWFSGAPLKKTGVKPNACFEFQVTNDHRQVIREWRIPISVGELSRVGFQIVCRHLPAVDVSSCVFEPGASPHNFNWRRGGGTLGPGLDIHGF